MRRIKWGIFCAIFILLALSLLQGAPEVYSKTMPIIKILAHSLGYKIYYLKTNMKISYFYVPKTWFVEAGGKGTIIWGNDPAYPYFSIIWIDNKFSHIKLYLVDNLSHASWGSLEATEAEIRDKFNIQDLQIEF